MAVHRKPRRVSGVVCRARWSGLRLRANVAIPSLLAALAAAHSFAGSAQSINGAAGMSIFSDGNLWDDDPGVVASRLGLVKESETAIDSVYRAYPGGFAESFGGKLKSIQLAGGGGGVTGVSFVFSNRGDGGHGGGSLSKAIRDDKDAILRTLNDLLGRPEPASIGRGVRREAGFRWDWEGHSFVMVHRPDSYVALRLVPTQALESGGAGRTRDSQVRDAVSSRVIRRANGDVVLGGLPMVNQGEKGYCVPAVWEMALRSMGVEADMYLLGAEMASDGGSGTDLRRAVDVGRAVAEEGGRSMTILRLDGGTKDLSRWIDRGIPLIWPMRCSEEFIASGLERTAARRGMTDPNKWKQARGDGDKAREIAKARWFGHVCLIVGYNHATGEVAIADSWGHGHHERWHTQEEIKAVSSGEFFAFDF